MTDPASSCQLRPDRQIDPFLALSLIRSPLAKHILGRRFRTSFPVNTDRCVPLAVAVDTEHDLIVTHEVATREPRSGATADSVSPPRDR